MNSRNRLLVGAATTALCVTGLSLPAQAQIELTDRASVETLGTLKARSFRGSEMSSAVRMDSNSATVGRFLQSQGMSASATDTLEKVSEFTSKFGRTHVQLEQRIGGKRVHGALVKAAFDDAGNLMSLQERLVNAGSNSYVGFRLVGPDRAISAAIKANHPDSNASMAQASRDGNFTWFDKGEAFYQNPSVEEVIIARPDGGLSSGYLVETWGADDNKLYHTLVDGFGRVVSSELRTSQDSYNIFPDHPGNSNQTIVDGANSGNAESPQGWLSGSQTSLFIQGNNARAYLDRNNNNAPDGGGVTITNGNFVTSANLFNQPTTNQNQEVAVQSLFYYNNLIHDTLYRHGFTEATGNFQENNFGRGGFGSDSVNAEAQDGGSTNNANFATPGDGSNPRMQMYLWTQTNPQRDGDVDSDIIWHEYGHGLTWRMIGSMSGAISGAIGEGMSDVLAILQNDNDVVGEYSVNSANGIRSAAYTNYPRDITGFTAQSVHFDGEIYAATIWRLYEVFQREGLSRDLLMDYLVDGMNFTSPGPDYQDMRDGILDAVPASQDCLVWEAFAAFGMGDGFSMPVSGNTLTINESFSVPAACTGNPDPDPDPDPEPQDNYVLTSVTGFGTRVTRSRWVATAQMVIENNGIPESGVTLGWSFSQGGSGTCVTDNQGVCTATSSRLRRSRVRSVTFTVQTADREVFVGQGVPLSITINRR